jgi:hypothetical protein
MIGLTHKQRDLLTRIHTIARFVTHRAHVRPALWYKATNDNFPLEAWHG